MQLITDGMKEAIQTAKLQALLHNESLVLFNAYKQVSPEGFISKNDIDFEGVHIRGFPTILIFR